MASERGGYRRPSESQSFSGVGKNSRRTDKQAVRSPNVQDSEDLQVGDRERIRQGQKTVPLGRVSPPRVAAPPSGASGAAGGRGAVPPEFLFSMPGPEAPMEMPSEQPPEEMEVVLQGLIQMTGDQSLSQMLSEHREFKAWKTTGQAPAPVQATPQMTDLEPEPDDEPTDVFDLATEGGATGEEVDQTSVETPVVPSEGGEDDLGSGLSPQETGGDATMV